MCNGSLKNNDKKLLWLGLGGQKYIYHNLCQIFRLYQYFDIDNYPIDLAFQVTYWHSKYCSSVKKIVAFDCASEANY